MEELEDRVVLMRHQLVGPTAAAAWLAARGLCVAPGESWIANITLEDDLRSPTCSLQIGIETFEWSACFNREDKMSWIRVLDVPHVQERDDFELLPRVPALRNLGSLVSWIEDTFEIRFRRAYARVRTSLPNAEDTIRLWVVASL